MIASSILNGLGVGGVYALIALGLVLAFRATGTFNFAHGSLMTLGALILGKWLAEGGSFWLGLIVALTISAASAGAFYLLCLRRTTGLPHWMGLVATFGLAAILDGIMNLIFGPTNYTITLPGQTEGSVVIGGARISIMALAIMIGTLVLAVAIVLVLRYSVVGVRMRGAGQDALLASQSGINVRRYYLLAWAAAGALAVVAGVSYGATNVVNLSLIEVSLLAFPAMLLGGLDSIEGAIFGGVVVGLIQGFVSTYWGGEYIEVVTYTMLLVVLLAYPRGLFGTEEVTKI